MSIRIGNHKIRTDREVYSIVLQFLAIFLVSLLVAATLTALYLIDFRSDCSDKGGQFSMDATTATCRY